MNPYIAVQEKLRLTQELPYTPDWSAAPDFIDLIVDYCLQAKPDVIVECSSGLTTLVLSRCCQINQKGQVISLENGEEYAEKTRRQLQAFDLDAYAQVLYAPLKKVSFAGDIYDWYDLASLPRVAVDMLVIDGPPGFIQEKSRYPAIPLLFDCLAKQARIFLDDAARDDEKKVVTQWLKEYLDMSHEYINAERGCSVLTLSKNG